VPAGIHCAVRPRALGASFVLGRRASISIPVFLTGIFLITIFSVWLGWLPAFGRGETIRLVSGRRACSAKTVSSTWPCRR
jgi:peptide/nickel transport system permease protein